MPKTFSFALAGSTQNSVASALPLVEADDFTLEWILTPQPRLVGRQQVLTPSPVQKKFSQLPAVLINKKINSQTAEQIKQQKPVDFLLVVDFGYFLPEWLLKLPAEGALNIHPSLVPRWRGASPGQFVLLSGEKQSGVSLFQINQNLDQGPIVYQQQFEVDPNWTQQDYYRHSFELISPQLPQVLRQLAAGQIEPQPQPLACPTPLARTLDKDDAFIEWRLLSSLTDPKTELDRKTTLLQLPAHSVLKYFLEQETTANWPLVIERATRALAGWPTLWTKIPTSQGPRRMQLISCQVKQTDSDNSKGGGRIKLELDQVRIAGQDQASWNQVKNILV
ncbi:MAG: hypothetical protein GF381_02620 [Candidatus Pacebacteria bacterium]|nr:hypothetical protein [Candidatus Paceibacterota bacterium]